MGVSVFQKLENCALKGNMVIFGACWLGWCLYRGTQIDSWKCFVDNYPKSLEYAGLPLIKGTEFLEKYDGEFIVIASKRRYREIYEQLIYSGIPLEKIVNLGKIAEELELATYFDLEYLKPADGKEIFCDAGGYDAMSSINFKSWSKKDNYTYIFEPDVNNIGRCYKNLENSDMKYKIIKKGLWNKETELRFYSAGNSSGINNNGEMVIPVTTIDKELKDIKVTFLKMDIEETEKEALVGAKHMITNNNLKLAISVYHKPENIWEVPYLILKYNSLYKLYLRHYSLTECDTVLYAI